MGLWDKIKDGLTTDKGEVAEETKTKADEAQADAAKAHHEAAEADRAAREQAKADGTAAPAPTEAPEPPAAAPHEGATVKTKKHLKEYTVVSGDTLSEIGARFGVDWHDIARINDIPNPDLIYPGQVFKIPAK
jgi:nucleoid-associated protein YgaU